MSCEGEIQTVIESPGWWRSHNHVSSVEENNILNRVPLCALRKKTGGAGLPKLSGTQISPSGSPGANTELQDLPYVLLIFWLALSNICLLCFRFLSEWKHLLCANICCKYVTFGGLTVKRFSLSLRRDFGLRTVLALLKTIGLWNLK